MLTLCKSTVLAAAFLAGVVIAANADPASTSVAGTVANGVSNSQSQGRSLAALPPSTATSAPNDVTLPETKNYRVPSDLTPTSICTPTPAASVHAHMNRAAQLVKKLPRTTPISAPLS
jgi:hypothetical protein